jgi:hypothetical protein
MSCYICGQEAVERCYTCGKLFCAQHGQVNCTRCETAIAPGNAREDRVSRSRLAPARSPAWWRPQQAEDFDPPACHACQGLARQRCSNCDRMYCAEHAGPNRLCSECGRSSLLGLVFLLLGLAVMVAMALRAILE